MKYTPRVLIGILGHLIPKYSSLLYFKDPIHIPSVFDQLILRPEMFRNWPSSSNKTSAELVSRYYYMALACGRYNARSDWLIVTEL